MVKYKEYRAGSNVKIPKKKTVGRKRHYKAGVRKFGKKILFLGASTKSKTIAEKKAKYFRKHYKTARVIKDKKGNFEVYSMPIPARSK